MKKFISTLFVFLFALQVNYAFASTTINSNIKIDKAIINTNDTINLTLELSNIQGNGKGINAFIGTLNFDSTKFELVKIEGLNEWNNPSYNLDSSKNGTTKIATTKNVFSKEDGDVIKIVLKAKKDINDYSEISITDMSVAAKTNEKTEKILLDNQILKINEQKEENNTIIEENKNVNKNFIIWIVIVALIFMVVIVTTIVFFKFRKGGNIK